MGRVSISDVVVGSVVLAAIGGVAIAANAGARETANRVACAQNLKLLGQAILLYSNENRNAYPRTTHDPKVAAPTWGTPYADDGKATSVANADPFAIETTAAKEVLAVRPKANDVTAALFLLLRTQDVLAEYFICPSTRGKPFAVGGPHGILGYTNFTGKASLARNLSYSYQNPYAVPDAVARGFRLNNSIPAEFAVMADMNPGGEALLTLKPDANRRDVMLGNSLNHGREGQNVLYGDGHIEFQTSPFVGIARDNIYVAADGGPARAAARAKVQEPPAIVASPTDAYDSILLPTASDLGQDQPLPPVAKADDAAALVKRIAGRYTYTKRDRNRDRDRESTSTMTIDDKAIVLGGDGGDARFDYEIAGTRGDAVVVTLKHNGNVTGQADLTFIGSRLYFDSDDLTGLLVRDGGAGPGWQKAK